METIKWLFEMTVNVMKTPLTLYGFTFSMWQVFLFSAFFGVVVWVIFKLWG